MKIEVLGMGCAKCQNLYDAARRAVQDAGVDASVEKVQDLAEIMKRGVLVTPALAVDGKVVVTGRVPSSDEIAKFF